MAHQGNSILHVLNVIESKACLGAGLHAAGLQGAASGENAHHLQAKIAEDVVDGASKACSIRQQDDHGSDAPSHAQHGERRPPAVVAHRGIGWSEQIVDHLPYSFLSASTGASIAALRAGYNPATIPASERAIIAAAAEPGTMCGGSKNGGSGISFINDIRPCVAPIPMPPLNSVRNAPSRKNCISILRLLAPTAFISPISLVRSVTETSMILTMPIAPSASVTRPTPPRKMSMAVKILPTVSALWMVSQPSKASGLSGSKPWLRAMILWICATAPFCCSRLTG